MGPTSSSQRTEEGTVRVLHVDDDPDFSDLVSIYLEREDDRFDVMQATSAGMGLDRLSEQAFDCVVSDYDMPGCNGIEFLQEVREQYPDLPFILFTGKGTEEIASDAISAGVTEYLQKESCTDQYTVLANTVSNAVEHYRAQAYAEETEHRLLTIAENTNDILWKFSVDWDELLFINSPYEEIWGQSITELRERPQSFLEGIHPEDRDLVEDAMGQLSNGESVDIEYRVNADEDFGRWVCVQGEPVVDADGEVEKVVGSARDITERKERVEEIVRLKDRFQAFTEFAPDIITIVDETGHIQYKSPSVERVLGYEPEELIGATAFEHVHPDDRESVVETFDTVIGSPDSVTDRVTYRFKHADGSWVWLESVGSNRTNNTINGYVINTRDITQRKERVEDLNRILDFFERAERLANLGAWEFDASGGAEWTDGTRRIHEVDEDFDPSVDTGIEFYHPDDRDMIQEAVETALETGESYDVEARIITAQGNVRWIHTRGTPLNDGEQVRGHIQDITERKERRRELQAFRTAVESSGNSVYWTDDGGTIEYVNPAFESQTGYSAEEAIGQNPKILQSGEHEESFYAEIWDTILAGDNWDGELINERKNGEQFVIQQTIAPITGESGDIERFVAINSDVTERKKHEEELARQNERLDEFASVVSHDLRNPLNVAAGRLELVKDEYDNEHLDAIERALERMSMLIDDILTLAHEGEDVTGEEPAELADLMRSCWKNVETADARLRIDVDDTILADRSRVRQLFENLLRNAVEHGGDDVTVTMGELNDGFYVEDDGPGIPPATREDVLNTGYSTEEAGTGFGLNIVKQVAEAHGWTIRIAESSEGGARFELTGVQVE